MAIKPAQCRAARGLLDWTREDLGRIAGVGSPAVSDFERGIRVSRDSTVRAMAQALEGAGVVFIVGDEPGVKLSRLGAPVAWQPMQPRRGRRAVPQLSAV